MRDHLELEYEIIGKGETVIVFENGLGGSMYDWYFAKNEIKDKATIVSYHRAGYGRSDSSSSNRITRQIASELNFMLEEIGIEKEIIFVGHSFGGLCVQQYVRMYPHKIRSVILVDSTSVNFAKLYSLDLPTMYSFISIENLVESWNRISKKSRDELQDTLDFALTYEQTLLPIEEQERIKKFELNPKIYGTMASEIANWQSSSIDIKQSGKFPDIPLIVIARDSRVSIEAYMKHGIPEKEAIMYENVWRELQWEQSLLSKKGKLIIAEGSDHNIHLEKPKIIVDCIKNMI